MSIFPPYFETDSVCECTTMNVPCAKGETDSEVLTAGATGECRTQSVEVAWRNSQEEFLNLDLFG